MKLAALITRTSSSESIRSNGSRFSLKSVFRRKRRSSSVSQTSVESPSESLFETPIYEEVPESLEHENADEYDFDTDDLSSVDSMFGSSYDCMSMPNFQKQEFGSSYKTVANHGRQFTKDWDMRYDTVLCQFYYVNKHDNSIQFDSPSEVLQY